MPVLAMSEAIVTENGDPEYARKIPDSRQSDASASNDLVVELRRLRRCRQVEQMAAIRITAP